jgi:hypothetical protein
MAAEERDREVAEEMAGDDAEVEADRQEEGRRFARSNDSRLSNGGFRQDRVRGCRALLHLNVPWPRQSPNMAGLPGLASFVYC